MQITAGTARVVEAWGTNVCGPVVEGLILGSLPQQPPAAAPNVAHSARACGSREHSEVRDWENGYDTSHE